MNETDNRPAIARAVCNALWQSYLAGLLLTNTPRLFETLQRIPWYQEMLREWTTTLNTEPGDDWLDVGCGPALLTAMLGQQGKRVIGLDHSVSMLRHARGLPEIKTTNVSLVHGNAVDLPFADQSFDYVLAASLINVVGNPIAVLVEMARVTRSGGKLSCLVPSPEMRPDNVEKYIKHVELDGIDAAALRLWSSRAKKISQPGVIGLMQAAGLDSISCKTMLDGMVIAVSATRDIFEKTGSETVQSGVSDKSG